MSDQDQNECIVCGFSTGAAALAAVAMLLAPTIALAADSARQGCKLATAIHSEHLPSDVECVLEDGRLMQGVASLHDMGVGYLAIGIKWQDADGGVLPMSSGLPVILSGPFPKNGSFAPMIVLPEGTWLNIEKLETSQ